MNKTGRKGVMKNNLWMLGKIWKYTPVYIVLMIVEGVAWGINGAVGIFYTKELLDTLSEGTSLTAALSTVAWYGAYILIFYIFHFWYWQVYNPYIHERLHIEMHTEMFKNAVNLDLERYDDPAFYNDFIWSMDQAYTHAVTLMEDTGKIINRIVATFAISGVIFTVDPLMAVLVLVFSVLRMIITYFQNRVRLRYFEELNPMFRKDGYYQRVFTLPDYAKDLRVSRVSENILSAFNRNLDDMNATVEKYGNRTSWLMFLNFSVMQLCETGLLLWMLYRVMICGAPLGGFAVAMTGIWRLSFTLRDLVDRVLRYHEHGIFIEKMISFMSCKPKIVGTDRPADGFRSLEIRNLSFAYNDGEKVALRDVNLRINKGEKIAIVGYNGAGKTTLVKLILRLYDASAGKVLYNGEDIKAYSLSSIRQRVAAVFQDYRIFAATVAENVAGGLCSEDDKAAVLSALERSTFSGKLSHLPDGLSTQLTREFYNSGTVLSGGEQQKVAIARAFYRDADLIILDEPSSALDPDAEYELNRAIAGYAADKTVIFISHRLSTTRHADRIYMFDSGRLIECGTHEELIEQDGKYAYMFNLQAEKYRKSE